MSTDYFLRLILSGWGWTKTLLALSIALYLAMFIVKSRAGNRRKSLGREPAVISTFAPLGIDLAWQAFRALSGHMFYDWTRSLADKYGRTYEMQMMGMRLIVTDEPQNIKAIMSSQFSDYGKGELTHKIFESVLGDSVFATDGKEWLRNKAQLRPHLARHREDDLAKTEVHWQQALRLLDLGLPVDIYDVIDRYQLDIVTDIYLGKSTASLVTGTSPIRYAVDTLFRINGFRQMLGKAGVYLSEKWLCPKAIRELESFLDSTVAQTLALPIANIEKKPVLERNLVESLAIQRLDARNIKNQLIAVIIGAKDPTSITITWAVYELARHPEVFAELRAQLLATLGTSERPPTREEMSAIPLLRNIVLETLRLYHPLGFNLRIAQKDTTLPRGGGPCGNEPIGVLKGTQIIYSVMSMQRREESSGPNSETWNPDRWSGWTPGLWDFVPFNNGPRICLGRAAGQLQVEYTVARIAQEFSRIELVEGEQQRIKLELNTKMAYPLVCTMSR
ncbi:hypothetical protein BLS_009313 [Venturia inaequalis]|uniref:Cytochrome P450 n=2 Tax=Venturia inaequalis TaxID=5025 RepID=A0A8H3U745_VENIN|nr:hypothetical protein BLS_009313 [Venturia inaequalis]